jgi:ATP-binding protein involved in chromosome partitioning
MSPESDDTAFSPAHEREEQVRQSLRAVIDPELGDTIVDLGMVRAIAVTGGHVVVEVALTIAACPLRSQIEQDVRGQIEALEWVGSVEIRIATMDGPERAAVMARARWKAREDAPETAIPASTRVLAVASGKGGVGKSTVAANLALAWAAQGARVGLLDADIYGPSQPLMMGVAGRKPETPDGKHINPLRAHGIEVMSIGFMIDAEQPMAWRGPMVTQALTQLLGETNWGALDYLVVDMPPGTGDIQLTLAQRVPVSGAVIVTTPQDIALLDARKGLKMFEKVEVRVLGVVENMSVHVCSNCGHAEHIFGSGGGARMAQQYGVQFLGELPLDIRIREEADGGSPTVVADPQSARAQAYFKMARRAAARLATLNKDYSSVFPKITVEAT